MKVAIPVCEGRVSNVFDFARSAIAFDVSKPVDGVIEAYRKGDLGARRFALPGDWQCLGTEVRPRCGW